MPGCLIAMGRVNRPSLMVYGGTIRPGASSCNQGTLDIVSAFQSYGSYLAGTITETQRQDIVRHSCPGAGACGGMYTANTSKHNAYLWFLKSEKYSNMCSSTPVNSGICY